jgi:cell division protein FtsW
MRKVWNKIDKPLFIVFITLILIGLVMIYSSSSVSSVLRYDRPSYYFFEKQLIFVIGAFIVGYFIMRTPTKFYKGISYVGLIAFSFLLISLITKRIITNNASSWYKVGFLSIQPSEFVKSFSILTMGYFYGRYFSRKNPNIIGAIIPMAVYVGCAILIILQPDLGSAAIYAGIVGAIFLSLPFKEKYMKYVKYGSLVVVFLALYILLFHSSALTHTQESRLNYKEPCSRYTQETGYQVCNGFIAIKNGGLFGVGLGNSTQKYLYLPESHTDFIFPIIVEELGLCVGILIILMYAYMLYRIYYISKKATNLRNQIICYGVFIYLALHILINFVGISALLPLTGVPLPLLSYGGSFVINVICMIFIVERIAYETSSEKNIEKIKNI